jgi:hypothetical protein
MTGQSKTKILIIVASGMLASACATQSANMLIGTEQPYVSLADQRLAVQTVAISDDVPIGARVLGQVDASRCHRDLTQREPSEEMVQTDLMVTAFARGADGIADVSIIRQSGLVQNCWYTLTGTATMYSVD